MLAKIAKPTTAAKGLATIAPCRTATLGSPAIAAAAENGNGNRELVSTLVGSRLYRDYERAFGNLTGLPVALQPVETWQLPHHKKANENALCALMSQKSGSCAAGLQVQERLCQQAATAPQTVTCALGLADSAVPVHMNDRLIGFLEIGQVFRTPPTADEKLGNPG